MIQRSGSEKSFQVRRVFDDSGERRREERAPRERSERTVSVMVNAPRRVIQVDYPEPQDGDHQQNRRKRKDHNPMEAHSHKKFRHS